MTVLKLCLLFLLTLAVLFSGLFHLDADDARWLQSFLGYYLCLTIVSLVLLSAWQERRTLLLSAAKLARLQWLLLLVLSSLATYLLLLHEPFMMRVFGDEPGHLATARAMAEERAVFSPQAGVDEAGAYATVRPSPIYRMYAYPFVVSVLHNLTGYRIENGFIVNSFTAFALCLGTFFLGRAIGGRDLGGYCALALLMTSPLLAQVANSASYDLFNICVLAFYALSCIHYSRQPGIRDGMNLCLALGLFLSYCRSESILFVSIFIGIFLYKCWQQRRIELSWMAALSPLLLIGPFAARVLANILSASFEKIYETSTSGFFSTSYIQTNFRDYLEWAFSLDAEDLNAFLISLLFFTLVPIGVFLLLRKHGLFWQRKTASKFDAENCALSKVYSMDPLDWVLFGFLCILVIQNGMILSMSWSPVHFAAIRFYLPSTLFMVLGIIWVMRMFNLCLRPSWRARSFEILTVVALGFFWMVTLPKAARAQLTHQNASAVYAEQSLSWLKAQDDGRTLYVVRATSFFTLYEIPCVGLDYFRRNYAKINELVALGIYDSVTLIDYSFYDSGSKGWRGPAPYIDLPPEIVLEPVDSYRKYIHGQVAMNKVLGWREADGSFVPLGYPPKKPTFENEWDFFEEVRRLRGAVLKGADQ
jgi:hypothetical protein